MSKKYHGAVVAFRQAYGFVYCEELQRRVFFHVADLNGPDPVIGDVLEFELGPSKTSGKPEAARNIRPSHGGAQ